MLSLKESLSGQGTAGPGTTSKHVSCDTEALGPTAWAWSIVGSRGLTCGAIIATVARIERTCRVTSNELFEFNFLDFPRSHKSAQSLY